jgi:hypothetical protein
VHCWYVGDEWDSSDAAYAAVSPWDNYLLWLLKDRYEFMDPGRAIERGYGFYSQVSRIVYLILDDRGIPSKVLEHMKKPTGKPSMPITAFIFPIQPLGCRRTRKQ